MSGLRQTEILSWERMLMFIFNFPSGIEFSLSVLQSCQLTGFLFESCEFLFHVEATTSLAFSVQDLTVTSYHKVVSAGSKYTQICGEAPSSVFCTTSIIIIHIYFIY